MNIIVLTRMDRVGFLTRLAEMKKKRLRTASKAGETP
jgi:hypothetical protein